MNLLILLSSFFFAAMGLAAEPIYDNEYTKALLKPEAGDLSMTYLATIFGVVDETLHGTGSQIIGNLFHMFNSVILCFAGILCGYISFIGTLNTSAEGEFLGKKWSSLWIPIRIITGTILLMPKAATGYALIQIIVMSIAQQGVGAANAVWNKALDYLQNNGAIVEVVRPITYGRTIDEKTGNVTNEGENTFLIGVAGQILKSQTCMFALDNALKARGMQGLSGNKPLTVEQDTTLVNGKLQLQKSYSFPGASNSRPEYVGFCGRISWGENDPNGPANHPLFALGVRQMIWNLLPFAHTLAHYLIPPPQSNTLPGGPRLSTITSKTPTQPKFVQPGDPFQEALKSSLNAGLLINTASDFFGITKPALRKKEADNQASAVSQAKAFIPEARKNGWITIGSYHFELAKVSKAIQELTDNLKIDRSSITTEFKLDYTKLASLWEELVSLFKQLSKIDPYIERETKTHDPNNRSEAFPEGAGGITDQKSITQMMKHLSSTFSRELDGFQKIMASTLSKHKDPVLALAIIGSNLIGTVEAVWSSFSLGVTTVMGALTMASSPSGEMAVGVAPSILLGLGATALLSIFTPLLAIWIGINFTIGATLAYYIPLLPFLLFFFGTLSWFAFVIEALTAAPVIALGVTFPEGHDILGRAEQSVMLLVSLFLRPMLMVFGFIFGMILCTIAFHLFHYGFGIAIKAVKKTHNDGLGIVSNTAMMSIYATTAVAIVNRTFSMIYEVPTKVLRWVGGPAENQGEMETIAQIRSGVDRSADESGRRVSEAAISRGSEANRDRIQQGQKAKKSEIIPTESSSSSEAE